METKSQIESFRSIVMVELSPESDLFDQELRYLVGGFSIASLPDYKTLGEILDAINPHAEVSIGIGYQTYRRTVRLQIEACREEKGQASFMLPLWDGVHTYNFLGKAVNLGSRIGLLFFYYDVSGKTSDMDAMLANNFKDSLTGLFNRFTMVQHVSANRRDGYLCLFDLNKFKAINDTFGHEAGDEVLCRVARFLIQNSTDDEVFYRRSGDEFMILAFRHEKSYIEGLIKRLADHFGKMAEEMPHCPGLSCGASFGILELSYPEGEDPIPYEIELQLTDLAMYQAKYAGKLSHYISHEDALDILASGELSKRLSDIAKKISR